MSNPSPDTAADSSKSNPGQVAARASWVALLAAVAIVYFTRKQGGQAAALMTAAFVAFGLLFGVGAMLCMGRYGTRKILIPGLCGVLLNGAVLVIAMPNLIGTRPAGDKGTTTQVAEPLNRAQVESSAHPYRFDTPGPRWQMRPEQEVRRERPEADLWLVDPVLDAHLIVMPEIVEEGYEFDVDALASGTAENLRAAGVDQVSAIETLKARNTTGRMFEGEMSAGGTKLDYRFGIFARGRHGIKVLCYGSTYSYAEFSPACDRALRSFEFIEDRVLF